MTRGRLLLGIAGAAIAASLFMLPSALRLTGFFRVRQVELVGVSFLDPESVLASLDLADERDLFQATGDLEERAQGIPGVLAARVERRLPGTLRIMVREKPPVAFLPGSDGLIALDGDAHPLAYDPTATGFDLPLVERADSLVMRSLAAVRAADSLLFGQVSYARRGEGDAVILELEKESVILGGVPTVSEIVAIEAVRRHLRAGGHRFDRLDARFAHKVFVRLSGA